MGRTMPTHRMALEQLVDQLRPYARTLRRTDQQALAQLLDSARHRAAAASMLPDLTPLETALLSMLVAHQVELEELQQVLRSMVAGEGPPDHDPQWVQRYKGQLALHHGLHPSP